MSLNKNDNIAVYFAYYKWVIKMIKYHLFVSIKNENKDDISNYRNSIYHYSAH